MTPEQWFAIGRDVVMMAVGILVFYWGQDRQATIKSIEKRFADMEKRMDDAGDRSSKLATCVQGIIGRLDRLPEDLRGKFCAHDTTELMIDKAIQNMMGRSRSSDT
jgi:hypothetical protein